MHCQSYSGEAALSLRFATRNSRYSRAGPVDFLPASLRNDGITLPVLLIVGIYNFIQPRPTPPPPGVLMQPRFSCSHCMASGSRGCSQSPPSPVPKISTQHKEQSGLLNTYNIQPAHQLAINPQLRISRPVRKFLQTLPHLIICQNVEETILD